MNRNRRRTEARLSKSIERAATRSQRAIAHYNRGCERLAARRLAQAEDCFRQAIAIKPDFPHALANLASVLLTRGHVQEAADCSRAALRADPGHVAAWINLGSALLSQDQTEAAERHLVQATELDPNHATAWYLLGQAREALNRFGQARYCYEKALACNPRMAEACVAIGILQMREGLEAMSWFIRATEADSRYPYGWESLGALLAAQNKPEAAREAFRKASSLNPGTDAARIKYALAMPIVPESNEHISKSLAATHACVRELPAADQIKLRDPCEEINQVNFWSAYYGRDEVELQRDLARLYLKANPALGSIAPHCRSWRGPSSRVRLGIITAFQESHIVAHLFRGLIDYVDRDRFEVFALRSPYARRVVSGEGADRVVELPRHLAHAREVIADAQLDVLFYLDVMMDPMTYFLSFARLAPVQCTTWGHPVTTGIPNMDYFISAADWETPGAESHYSERLIRLKHLPMYCREPDLSGVVADRAQFGLPRGATIYSCPQSLFKVHPDFDAALAGLLRRDPKGLVMMLSGQYAQWNQAFNARFTKAFPDVADRIMFVPTMGRRKFLSLFACSDAVLDPFHWGGGNTTLEALACGVPVPTLPGVFMRGRLTLGFYRKMEMPELVVDSPREFIELNFRLANDRELRSDYQARMAQRLPAFYEDRNGLRELQTFFLAAVRARYEGARLLEDCLESQSLPAPN